MNRIIPKAGAALVAATVFLFALFLIVKFPFGYYVDCMFLPIGYILMAAGFHDEARKERRVASTVGLVFAAIYAVLIFVVELLDNSIVVGNSTFLGTASEPIEKQQRGYQDEQYDKTSTPT